MAEKQEHRRPSATSSAIKPSGANTPAKGTDGDVEMGEADAEGEEEDVSTPAAGTGAPTPMLGSTPDTPGQGAEGLEGAEEEDEDLFGDSEVEPDSGQTPGEIPSAEEEEDDDNEQEKDENASPASLGQINLDNEVDDVFNDPEANDEMAEMLKAELADLPSSPPLAATAAATEAGMTVESEAGEMEGLEEGLNEREVADANAALDDLSMAGMGGSSPADIGFGYGGVEGGVGMRRLASGMMPGDDDDEDSSDDSDD